MWPTRVRTARWGLAQGSLGGPEAARRGVFWPGLGYWRHALGWFALWRLSRWPLFRSRLLRWFLARWPTPRWPTPRWRLPRWRLVRWRLGQNLAGIAESERGRLVLWLPAIMGAGVLAYYDLRIEPPAWIGAKFAVAGFASAIGAANWPVMRAIGFSVGFAALGFASAQFATARLPPIETGLPMKAVILTGTVRAVEILPLSRRITLTGVEIAEDEARMSRGGRGRTVAAAAPAGETRELTRTVRIRLKTGDETAVETGDTIRVRGMVRPPSAPSFPGGWDTQRDAFFAGLGASGWALAPVSLVTHGPPARAAAWMQWLRETIASRVSAVVPGSAGAVAVTLLTGASRGIPEADHAAFRDSGLAHILAVAGLHIGIVMGLALAFARTLLALSERASLFWPTRKIAAVFALAAGGAYMMLTGAHVPIVRSFAMACLFTLAILLGRQPVSVRGLGLAGIAIMLIAPYEVPGVSFQMSFSAVLALIAGYETLHPWLLRLRGKTLPRRLLSYPAALILTSTLAGTASQPYSAYHFGHIQLYYIVSNVFAVPVTALWVLPAGMVSLMLMPFGLEWLALIPMGWGAALIIWIARITAALPDATLAAPHIPSWGLAVLSLGIAWLGLWRSRLRLLGVAAIVAGTASPMFDRAPDIFVSADAGLIGLRTEHGVFLQTTRGGSAFTRDAWLSRWATPDYFPIPAAGTAAAGEIACVHDACLFRPRAGEAAALLVRGSAKPAGCDAASVVVSAEPARGVCPYPAPKPVDRFTVWRNGPVAIWLQPHGARILSDREDRGERPWVPPPPTPRARPVSDLPAAPVDRTDTK